MKAWETPVALETEKASLTGSRRNNRRLMRMHTFCARFQPNSETVSFFISTFFLLNLLNHSLGTEKLERLKGWGYSIYDVKFDRCTQSCVPAQIWRKQENEYFKQFQSRSRFVFTIRCLCSNMNATREVMFQALLKHFKAHRKLYLRTIPYLCSNMKARRTNVWSHF